MPSGAINQPPFDLLRIDWAPVSYGDENRRGYSTSITVAGVPSAEGFYVSYGAFPSDVPGEECQLYNILRPGRNAFANIFCGSNDRGTRRFITSVDGSRVTTTSTAGGTSLTATFDDPVLPNQLEAAGRMLYNLGAFTSLCAAACAEAFDYATSGFTYHL